MNVLKNSFVKKILIVLITVIMLTNFVMPHYVYAKFDPNEIPMRALSALLYLVGKLGDLGLSILQKTMVGVWDLNDGGTYNIKYSPGLIFANEIPMLDANFLDSTKNISKKYYRNNTITKETRYNQGTDMDTFKSLFYKEYDCTKDNEKKQYYNDLNNLINKRINPKDESEIISYDDFIKYNADGKMYETNIKKDNQEIRTFEFCDKTGPYAIRSIASYDDDYNMLNASISLEYQGNRTNNGSISFNEIRDTIFKNLLEYVPDEGTYIEINDKEYQDNDKNWKIKIEKNGMIGNDYTGILEQTVYEEVIQTRTAGQLRNIISTWYNGLRMIALVGLLSVLLYIGIKIILSSGSAQNQAKYKNMLKDWLVALCILFVLHYIMSFMMTLSEKLIGIMGDNVSDSKYALGASDKLMNSLRTKMEQNAFYGTGSGENWTFGESSGYAIMWFAMVLITFVFTFQYMKRLIYLAFLTMIAPMIALTYPLDKIKDGKAQAFSFWLREYIFNCLLQPVHLLIYTVFISSAFSFAESNILYALLALAFMMPAEKIIKEMFGLKSSGPSNAINAAAGGAIVMSMINKLRSKGGSSSGEGKEKNESVRTANPRKQYSEQGSNKNSKPLEGTKPAERGNNNVSVNNNLSSNNNETSNNNVQNNETTRSNNVSNTSSNNGGNSSINNASDANNVENNTQRLNNSYSGNEQTNNTQTNNTKSNGVWSGLNAVGKKYIYGPDRFRSYGRTLRRSASGAALGIIAGGATVAANIADGELFSNTGKAFSEIGVAGGIGYAAGKNFSDKTINNAKNVADTFRKGAVSTQEYEAYQNKKFDRAFYKSEAFGTIARDTDVQSICAANGMSVQEATQGFLNEGITDPKVMREAIKNNISGEAYADYTKAGITSVKDMAKLNEAGVGVETYKIFENAGIKDINKIKDSAQKLKDKGLSNEQIAYRAAIASDLSKKGIKKDTPRWQVNNILRQAYNISANDIDEIYENVKELLK